MYSLVDLGAHLLVYVILLSIPGQQYAQPHLCLHIIPCNMGNFCSKSSTLSGGHQVLGGSESNTNVRGEDEEARRARIAEAAQRRLEEVRSCLTTYHKVLC